MAGAQPVINLSLQEAFDRAPEANFRVLIDQESLLIAEASARRSRSNLIPGLSAGANQSRQQSYSPPRTGSSGGTGGGTGTASDPTSIFNSFDAKLRLNLASLGPQEFAEYAVARMEVDIAELDLLVTVQDVLEGIGTAYFAHLRNQRRLEVIEANIARDRVLLQIAQNQFDAGVATPIDVTRAEVQLASDELDLLQQRTIVYQSELDLKRLLNFPMDARLVLEPMPLNEVALETFSSTSLGLVLDNRPEYEREVLTLERNQTARRAARLERLPSLSLDAEYGYGGETIDDDWEEEWLLRLGLSVPIWEGGRIAANVLQAQALVRQQEYVVEDLSQAIEADYRFILEDVRSRFAQIAVARRQVALRERELELARIRFQEGVADNADVVEAQAFLAAANDEMVEAEFRYNLSRVNLARIRGDVRQVVSN